MPTTVRTKVKPPHVAVVASPLRGQTVRMMTTDEQLADMEAHGREVRKTKASALAFLQRAGIVNDKGELADPYQA